MRIYIVNPECMVMDKFVADPAVDAAIMRAWRRHVFKGFDRSVVRGFDLRVGDVACAADIAFRDPAHEAAYRTAIADGLEPVAYLAGEKSSDVVLVSEWASEVARHTPTVHRAILNNRVSFAAMVEHANGWHEAKARRAERLKDRAIPRDDVGAPTVLDLDGPFVGWRWVWLKSDDARDAEGEMMGHCVGDGYYDGQSGDCGVFSLRDEDDVPHVTVELDGMNVGQAKCRGNDAPPPRMQTAIDELALVVGARLRLMDDPTAMLSDGRHDVVIRGGGVQMHIKDGRLHRDVGPAYVSDCVAQYYSHGVLGREFRIHLPMNVYSRIDHLSGGKLHREDGPAVQLFWPNGTEQEEWYRRGEKTEEDGSPFVEPKYFSRGYMHTDGGQIRFVTRNHRAKGSPDPALMVALDGRTISDTLRALDADDVKIEDLYGRNREAEFTTGGVRYRVTFKYDGEVDAIKSTTAGSGYRYLRSDALFMPHGGPPQRMDMGDWSIQQVSDWKPMVRYHDRDVVFLDGSLGTGLRSRAVVNALETRDSYIARGSEMSGVARLSLEKLMSSVAQPPSDVGGQP